MNLFSALSNGLLIARAKSCRTLLVMCLLSAQTKESAKNWYERNEAPRHEESEVRHFGKSTLGVYEEGLRTYNKNTSHKKPSV